MYSCVFYAYIYKLKEPKIKLSLSAFLSLPVHNPFTAFIHRLRNWSQVPITRCGTISVCENGRGNRNIFVVLFVSSFLKPTCCDTFLQIQFILTNSRIKCPRCVLAVCCAHNTLKKKKLVQLINEENPDLGQLNCPGTKFDELFTMCGIISIRSD